MQKGMGFTLIELIVVVVIISILGVLSIGLFSSPSQYSASLSSKQWLTQLRSAQLQALQKQDANNLVQFLAQANGNEWRLQILFRGNSITQVQVSAKDQRLAFSDSDFSSACSALPSANLPLRFFYDGLGRFVASDGSAINSNQRLCFEGGNSVIDLCLAPSGLAYEGACVN
ncbi:prepilin-type N-terminal cleavage/methylation domain-containing protein [Bermanella marisrubri]|uniref:Uncharacterized protein n=1 Tax=Bermanella marisrubri TaxID=207949 RepID=Q1N2G6_9GAMM|nr:prepilin-type N-terminal cleavage/methylation domain-containing protein [Bermanella marisrubri]EAT12441.1 hypothetical protein RED65_16426 [Oceanobacter sp. RED65] [Bermanella marisrubri]QIZ85521.1 prepilin-type N-terminal cleavage/methylation domain-containing protein [Bermanella marisrubri]